MEGSANLKINDVLEAALKSVGKTQADAAHALGLTPRQFSQRKVNGTLRAADFLEILDAMGIDIKYYVRSSGEEIRLNKKGYGRRVRQMVNTVIYDTNNASAICNSFWADGIHEYTDGQAKELYLSADGTYFLAQYNTYEGVKDRILPISAKEAGDFMEMYKNKPPRHDEQPE